MPRKHMNQQVGRFLSVDPLTSKYPMLTPYQYASNSPVTAIDLDGLEGFITMPNEQGVKLTNTTADVIKENILKSTFSHYLPKKFIDLYANGQGTPYRLSPQETIDLHVAKTGIHGVTKNDFSKANEFLNTIKPGESKELPEGYSIIGAALNGGTLGRFQIRLKGKVTKDENDNFSQSRHPLIDRKSVALPAQPVTPMREREICFVILTCYRRDRFPSIIPCPGN